MTNNISRRGFVLGRAATAAVAQMAKPDLTAGQVIERIKANVGIPWREQTVDRIIAGSGDTPVRGIATTMMATLDVVQRAAEAGRLIIRIKIRPRNLRTIRPTSSSSTSSARTTWWSFVSTITGTRALPTELLSA
jgi:hypothetical protein